MRTTICDVYADVMPLASRVYVCIKFTHLSASALACWSTSYSEREAVLVPLLLLRLLVKKQIKKIK